MTTEKEMADRIVTKTVDALELAERILKERDRRNGNDEPTGLYDVQELVAIAQVVTSLSLSGFYRLKSDEEESLWTRIRQTVDSRIEFKLTEDALRRAQAPRATPMPAPLPLPPPSLEEAESVKRKETTVRYPSAEEMRLAPILNRLRELIEKEGVCQPPMLIARLVQDGYDSAIAARVIEAYMRNASAEEPPPQGKVTS